jgi:hypothetical protein
LAGGTSPTENSPGGTLKALAPKTHTTLTSHSFLFIPVPLKYNKFTKDSLVIAVQIQVLTSV